MRSGLSFANATRNAAAALPGVVAFFQPIIDLVSGRTVGFEALARLQDGEELLTPDRFLPTLSADERVGLFVEMLRQAAAFVATARARHPALSVSVNVESSLVLRDDFYDIVTAVVPPRRGKPALYVELVESEQIADVERALAVMTRLKRRGVGFSLDDVGSAYSSLMMIKRLPVDVVKLDQAFARELTREPDDLQFVQSMVSLARGLSKVLVVEGVETASIQDALTVIGVEQGQGYAIARPMPVDLATRWLDEAEATSRDRVPRSMLGAYAAHLGLVEACRILRSQALPVARHENSGNPRACCIGQVFDRLGCHRAPPGIAHREFHAVIDRLGAGDRAWDRAAERFRGVLRAAVLAEAARPA